MLPLRYARTWLLAGLVLMVLGLFSALLPMPAAVEATVDDKILHGAVFLVFTVWFGGVFDRRFVPAIVVCLSAYGLLIELLQSLTASRQGDVLDLVADVAGVLLGWALSAAGLSRWCATLESWFADQKP